MARGRAAAGGCARCMGGAARCGPSPPGPPLCAGSGRRRTAHGGPRGAARLPGPARREQRRGAGRTDASATAAARLGGSGRGRARGRGRGKGAGLLSRGRGRGALTPARARTRAHTTPARERSRATAAPRGVCGALQPLPEGCAHTRHRGLHWQTLSPGPRGEAQLLPPCPKPGAGSLTPPGLQNRVRHYARPCRGGSRATG